MTNLEDVVWAQEEPKNAGAWFFVDPLIEQCLAEAGVKPQRARYAGRAGRPPRPRQVLPNATQPSRRR